MSAVDLHLFRRPMPLRARATPQLRTLKNACATRVSLLVAKVSRRLPFSFYSSRPYAPSTSSLTSLPPPPVIWVLFNTCFDLHQNEQALLPRSTLCRILQLSRKHRPALLLSLLASVGACLKNDSSRARSCHLESYTRHQTTINEI